MAASEIEEPPVLLGPRQSKANPLKLLELLVKGLCPTIIVDRVDVNGETSSNREAEFIGVHAPKKTVEGSPGDSSSAPEPSSPASELAFSLTPSRIAKSRKSKDATNQRHESDDINEKPFEIAERPPSDVIGISKKIWEGFCYNPYNNNLKHPSFQTSRKGFCSIITDHTCMLCTNEDEFPPEGEECSVGTASSSVDLSPQSSPCSISQIAPTYEEVPSFLVVGEEEFDEEEELPITEFQDKRSYRGTQVLVVTMLALYATLALLNNMGGHSRLQFTLESKQKHNPPRQPALVFKTR